MKLKDLKEEPLVYIFSAFHLNDSSLSYSLNWIEMVRLN